MLLDLAAPAPTRAAAKPVNLPTRWGVASEYGVLLDVMVSRPDYLDLVPCNSVTRDSIARGLDCSRPQAAREHDELVHALERNGVRCHFVPPAPGLADLCFTRDATFMTPWGLIELRPASAHRQSEPRHVTTSAASWGVPLLGSVEEGRIEGGDVCLLRPGTVAIGWSGDRTDKAGRDALARLFRAHGWSAIRTRFDPTYLHLDTLFTMVGDRHAVACVDALDEAFLFNIIELGIEIVPITRSEVAILGGNILSLGAGRLLCSAGAGRINAELVRRGFQVLEVEIEQFTRCGGGVHCLTMPLARSSTWQVTNTD